MASSVVPDPLALKRCLAFDGRRQLCRMSVLDPVS